MPVKKHTSLRVDEDTMRAIEASCAQRPGTVSTNTWIVEAIMEKLSREQEASGVRSDA
jgi:predicted HicB family RNase H-like nuclease